MLDSPGILLTLVAFLAVIGPLVFVHELGHYSVARWCGVHVETFSIGFGRSVLRWKSKHGTVWKIGWLPLGGYVQFLRERSASEPADSEKLAQSAQAQGESKKSTLNLRDQSYAAQNLWKRTAIVLAGPFANFLFAIVIYAAFFMAYGKSTTLPVVGTVIEDSAAADAKLRPGDRIVAIDGAEMVVFDDIRMAVAFDLGKPVELLIERGGNQSALTLRPRIISDTDRFGNKSERAIIGITPAKPEYKTIAPLAAVGDAVTHTFSLIRLTGRVLGQFITGQRTVKDMSGPLQIAKLSGDYATLGFEQLIIFIAFISINLGFINLLPLPMLDGGHLLFHAYEAIRRRPLSAVAQQWAYQFGAVVVAIMMLVVIYNDLAVFGVWKFFSGLIGSTG